MCVHIQFAALKYKHDRLLKDKQENVLESLRIIDWQTFIPNSPSRSKFQNSQSHSKWDKGIWLNIIDNSSDPDILNNRNDHLSPQYEGVRVIGHFGLISFQMNLFTAFWISMRTTDTCRHVRCFLFTRTSSLRWYCKRRSLSPSLSVFSSMVLSVTNKNLPVLFSFPDLQGTIIVTFDFILSLFSYLASRIQSISRRVVLLMVIL